MPYLENNQYQGSFIYLVKHNCKQLQGNVRMHATQYDNENLKNGSQ